MRSVLFGSIALLVSACANPAETCSSYGFEPGTQAYAECQLRVSEDNAARSARVATAMQGMTLQGQQQMGGLQPMGGGLQTPRRCIQNNYGFTCY